MDICEERSYVLFNIRNRQQPQHVPCETPKLILRARPRTPVAQRWMRRAAFVATKHNHVRAHYPSFQVSPKPCNFMSSCFVQARPWYSLARRHFRSGRACDAVWWVGWGMLQHPPPICSWWTSRVSPSCISSCRLVLAAASFNCILLQHSRMLGRNSPSPGCRWGSLWCRRTRSAR